MVNDPITERMNEIDVKLDFYLTRNMAFKPFVSVSTGFASMNNNYDGFKSYGMVFGAGLGFRHYMSNHIYLNTDVRYNIYPDMGVKAINGTSVGGTTMQMSEISLNVGLGYRF